MFQAAVSLAELLGPGRAQIEVLKSPSRADGLPGSQPRGGWRCMWSDCKTADGKCLCISLKCRAALRVCPWARMGEDTAVLRVGSSALGDGAPGSSTTSIPAIFGPGCCPSHPPHAYNWLCSTPRVRIWPQLNHKCCSRYGDPA